MPNQESAKTAGQPPPKWLLKAMTRVHVVVYRLTGGRVGKSFAGDAICMVTMKGAKTGKQRTVPLMYVPDGDALLLVASQGGAPKNPAWYHNLVAHPDIVVEQGGVRTSLRARQVGAEEKVKLWPICVSHYAPYEQYRHRTSRDIPVFRCEPR